MFQTFRTSAIGASLRGSTTRRSYSTRTSTTTRSLHFVTFIWRSTVRLLLQLPRRTMFLLGSRCALPVSRLTSSALPPLVDLRSSNTLIIWTRWLPSTLILVTLIISFRSLSKDLVWKTLTLVSSLNLEFFTLSTFPIRSWNIARCSSASSTCPKSSVPASALVSGLPLSTSTWLTSSLTMLSRSCLNVPTPSTTTCSWIPL
mmetsp:Transcript_15000/g.32477  ORF Transcript_15000/g.32477 Transcript_15000/m.32477 type:complete len:202 (-) Transcript_15000:1003-1608(-)